MLLLIRGYGFTDSDNLSCINLFIAFLYKNVMMKSELDRLKTSSNKLLNLRYPMFIFDDVMNRLQGSS